MGLTVQNGSLVLRNNALGTGEECCCQGGDVDCFCIDTQQCQIVVPVFVDGNNSADGTHWVNEIPTAYQDIAPLANPLGPLFEWKDGYPEALNSPCGYVVAYQQATTGCLAVINGIPTVIVRTIYAVRLLLPNCSTLTLDEFDITQAADFLNAGFLTESGFGASNFEGDFSTGSACTPEKPEIQAVTFDCKP